MCCKARATGNDDNHGYSSRSPESGGVDRCRQQRATCGPAKLFNPLASVSPSGKWGSNSFQRVQYTTRLPWYLALLLSSVTMGYLCITSDAKQKCKLGKMCQARLSYCPQTVPQVRTRSCSHMHFRPTTCQPAGLSPAVAALAPYSLVQELTKGSLGTWSVQVASGGF